jgi:FkbM family methyltransferase
MFEQRKFPGPMPLNKAHDLLLEIAADTAMKFPREIDKPLAIYGAGNLGRMACEYFAYLGIAVQFVVDANAENLRRADPYWSGKALLSPVEVPAEQKCQVVLAVCVANSPFTDLAQELALGGWRDITPFYDVAENFRLKHPLSNGWFASPLSSVDVEKISTVLGAWSDDVSRCHHLHFIAWRRLRQDWIFHAALINADDRFFIDEVASILTDEEAFADIGAHTGSVTQQFVDNRRGRFRQIWAVEPDEQSLIRLKVTIDSMSKELHQKITIISAAISSDNAERRFSGGLGYASQLGSTGSLLKCRTIDELGLSPTYLKLHIEGAELEALFGAKQTIKRYRPIIAATVYHNSLGLWALPLWLCENLNDYKLLMRVHSWSGTGAVVYAIPRERETLGWS